MSLAHPVTHDEIIALRYFEGAVALRYRALLNRALDELEERRKMDGSVVAAARDYVHGNGAIGTLIDALDEHVGPEGAPR